MATPSFHPSKFLLALTACCFCFCSESTSCSVRAEGGPSSQVTAGSGGSKQKKSPAELTKEIDELTLRIKSEPANSRLYGKRGLRYSKLERYNEAIADFDRAIELDPKESMLHAMKGYACVGCKKDLEAIRELSIAIAMDPLPAEYYQERSRCYSREHETAKALDDALNSSKIAPNDPGSWSQLARIELDLKKYKDAEEHCSHALKLNPHLAQVYLLRSIAYSHLNREGDAKADEARSRELGLTR